MTLSSPTDSSGFAAQQPSLVNGMTAGDQTVRAIGALADGSYAVAWMSADAPSQLTLQRYDATGNKLGIETIIALDLAGLNPAVAVLGDGSVLVACETTRVVAGTPYPSEFTGIWTQRFGATGAPLGNPTEVASIGHSVISQIYETVANPGIMAWRDGGYVISWAVQEVAGPYGTATTAATQRYDLDGAAVGTVRTFGNAADQGATLAFAPIDNGGYLFSHSLATQGERALIFSPVESADRTASIPAPADSTLLPLTDGGYVVWSGKNGSRFMQILDSTGAAVGPASVPEHDPAFAWALNDGGFLTFWSATDLLAQRYDGTGTAAGDAFTVHAGSAMPLVTTLSDGELALAWTAIGAGGDLDVFTQLLAQNGVAHEMATALPGGAASNDVLIGSSGNDSIFGLAGDDRLDGHGGTDVLDGGPGTDTAVLDTPVAGLQACSLVAGLLTLTTAAGTHTLRDIERVQFADALFALDTQGPDESNAGGHVWQAAALFQAAFGVAPARTDLSHWTAEADRAGDMGLLAQRMLDQYAPGLSSPELVSLLYQRLLHMQPSAEAVQDLADLIGPGRAFPTQGDLLARAAALPLNTDQMAGLVGSIQQLDAAWF